MARAFTLTLVYEVEASSDADSGHKLDAAKKGLEDALSDTRIQLKESRIEHQTDSQ